LSSGCTCGGCICAWGLPPDIDADVDAFYGRVAHYEDRIDDLMELLIRVVREAPLNQPLLDTIRKEIRQAGYIPTEGESPGGHSD